MHDLVISRCYVTNTEVHVKVHDQTARQKGRSQSKKRQKCVVCLQVLNLIYREESVPGFHANFVAVFQAKNSIVQQLQLVCECLMDFKNLL